MSKQSQIDSSLDQIIADYLKAVDAKRSPNVEAILARHEQWRAELEEFFAAQEKVAQWTDPLQALCAGPCTLQDQQTLGADDFGPSGQVHAEGATIGDYELIAEIARGGMGVVYRARQMRANRVVALKMILAGNLATATDVQRLRAEAEAAARLDHPHIVPIYEVGQHEGRHYFTMKLIEGRNLAQTAAAGLASTIGRNEQRQAAVLVAKVARAVHYAHQRGILHRDLKPANILVDAQGEPHVTDFGLAKRVEDVLDAAGTLPPALTQTGAIVGTPSYMAPEQASGRGVLTTAADTYSLGAVLFELLTGQPPFAGERPLEIAMQVVQKEPPRPRTLNTSLDYDLETISLKCLEKDPNRRYASAQALADDLERWLAGEPILGRRTTRRERTWKWIKRHKFTSSLLGLTGGAAAALIVLASILWHNAELRAAAVQDLGEARKELDKVGDHLKAARDAQQAARADIEKLQKAADAEKNNLKKLQILAELEKARTKEVKAFADRIVYAADMLSAHAAARAADVPHLMRLLEQHRPGPDREDLRGFEWHYLWNLAHRARYTLDAHVPKGDKAKTKELGAATFVAISPDGTTLASLGIDDTIRLWDLASGKPRGATAAPPDLIALEFAENGKKLQALSAKGEGKFPDFKALQLDKGPPSLAKLSTVLLVHSWDVGTMRHQVEPADFARLVSRPSFVAKPLSLNAVMMGAMLNLPEGIVSPATLARSHDGKLLAIGGILTVSKLDGISHSVKQEGVILLWDLVKNAPRGLLKGHESMVIALAFSPDGSLVTTGFEGAVKLWTADGKERTTLAGNRSLLFSVNFSADGKRLLGGGADGVVYVWELAAGKLEHILIGHQEPVASISVANDGRTLASASVDGFIKTWDLATVAGPTPAVFPGLVHKIAFAANGRTLFTLDQGGTFRTLDASTGKETGKRTVLDGNRIVTTAAISPDGESVAYYNFLKSAVSFRDIATGKEVHAPPSKGFIYAIAFPPAGDTLAIGTGLLNKSGQVIVWRPSDGKELFRYEDFKNKVTSLTFSSDGKMLAAGSADHSVVVLDVAMGRVVSSVVRPSSVHAVAFALDGKMLAVADDTGVSFHQTRDGTETLAFPTYSHRVAAMAFSPDGKRLATGGGAGDASRGTGVKLWDVGTGRETMALGDPSAIVRGLAFSPDGTRLAAAAGDISIINNFGQPGGKSVVTIWETGR